MKDLPLQPCSVFGSNQSRVRPSAQKDEEEGEQADPDRVSLTDDGKEIDRSK